MAGVGTQDSSNSHSKHPVRLLLVDDEPDITDTLKSSLESQGYKVDAFNFPVEVPIEKAEEYDIAILDVRMPEINGFELARLLWRQNDKLQVCFLSAFEIHSSEAMKALPNLKSHCFLTKPMRPSEIAAHIESHLLRQ